ncbi:MAG: hypothetical protein RLZZ272_200 [Actinomycetota bacterium]|jgi:Ser/Thr protein kinase RdoA (MazF antagonist)
MHGLHVKVVRPEASLAAHPGWSDAALRAIAAASPVAVLAPLPGPDGNFLEVLTGTLRYRTLRLHDPQGLHAALPVEEKARRMAAVAVQTGRDLRGIERPTGEAAEVHAARRRQLHERAAVLADAGILGEVRLEAGTAAALRVLLGGGPVAESACDGVAHGDLHPSNVVLAAGGIRVIDLENLMPAPAFTDLLYVARWSRRDEVAWRAQIAVASAELGRGPGQPDLQLCCEVLLVQASELLRRTVPAPEKNLRNIADALGFLLSSTPSP